MGEISDVEQDDVEEPEVEMGDVEDAEEDSIGDIWDDMMAQVKGLVSHMQVLGGVSCCGVAV